MASPKNDSKVNTAPKTQFKATEKWCELISAFRTGMPTGKHWHMFHWIDETFTGCEAVDWMFNYLKSCSEFQKVTKENALQLLNKFFDAGIMEEIKKPKGKFEYSGRLYKIVGESSPQPQTRVRSSTSISVKSTFAHANDGYQSDSDLRSSIAVSVRLHHQKRRESYRPISQEDVHMQWKMALVTKFEHIFGRGTMSQLIDMKFLSGANVCFNAIHVAANGMLSEVPGQPSDLPEWVVSSLTFLARWCDDAASNYPHFPGVEADLLRVIVQSFENTPEPLLPYVFHKLALFSVTPELLVSKNCNQFQMHPPIPKSNVRFESIENLLIDMASVSLVGCPSPILPNASRHGSRASRQQNTAGSAANRVRSQSSNRYNIRLETAFVGPNNETYTTFKFEEMPTQPALVPRQAPAFNSNNAAVRDSLFNNGSSAYSSNGRCHSVQNLVWQPMNTSNMYQQQNPQSSDNMQANSVACTENNTNGLRPFGSNLENIASIKHADSTTSLPVAVDLACDEQVPTEKPFSRQSTLSGSKTNVDPVISLQLALLFMPPPERRRLQLFVRLLSRLLENKLICQRLAPPHGDLRSQLVSMFATVFVRPKAGEDVNADMYNKLAVERLSALLLDKHSAIFAVPDWLAGDVAGRLERVRRLRSDVGSCDLTKTSASSATSLSPSTPSPRSVPAFCQRISTREFERHTTVIAPNGDYPDSSSPTHDSLVELLASIVNSTSLSKRDRAKRLKEFEKVYPDIYKEYFSSLEAVNLPPEDSMNVNKENQNSPSSENNGKVPFGGAPWMPRIKEPLLLKKIRQRFGNEQQ